MSHGNFSGVLVLAFLLSILHAGASASTIVYDNTTTPVSGERLPSGFLPFSRFAPNEEMGDEIALDGNSRVVTQFSLILSSSVRTTLSSLTVAFYRNDSNDAYDYYGAPGTQLWTASDSNLTVDGTTTVTFSVPNVEVPDTFAWTVSAASDSAGLATYDPPRVGSSGNHYWDLDHSDGLWYGMWFASKPVANFGAQVMAVPEPTTSIVLALGGLAALWRRRR